MTLCSTPGRLRTAALAFLAVGWGGLAVAAAHPAYLTAAQVTVKRDGQFTARFRFDLLAYALNDSSARIGNEPMEALLTGPRDELETTLDRAKGRLARGFRVVTDQGDGVVETTSFPDAEQVLAWRDHNQPVLPVILPVSLSGHLPPGARTVACRFPVVLDQVILTVERPGEEPEAEAIEAGKTSPPLPLRLEASGRQPTSAANPSTANQPLPTALLTLDRQRAPGSDLWLAWTLLLLSGAVIVYAWWRHQARKR